MTHTVCGGVITWREHVVSSRVRLLVPVCARCGIDVDEQELDQ